MIRRMILALAVIATIAAASANAAIVNYGGLLWNTYGGATVVDNGDGTITITQNSNAEGGLETSGALPAYAKLSYKDNPNANIDMFQQNISNALNPRTQNGSAFGCCSLIGYERYENGPAIEQVVYADLTPRIAGTDHTVETQLHGDGSLDHWFDGNMVAGTFLRDNVGGFGGWEQFLIRVRSNGQTSGNQVTITGFLTGDNRPGEVPEPGTYLLMSVGLGALALLRRRHANHKL